MNSLQSSPSGSLGGSAPPLLAVEGVVKRYGKFTAVDGVSFSVKRGECYGLLGPNGAGKTTLFKLITALARRSAGDLSVFGLDPDHAACEIKARVGVVGQEDSLDTDLDVWDNLLVYGRYFGLRGEAFRERCEQLLAFLELTEKRHVPIMALSGGLKRRLAIVRSLLNQPEFLLLDEPTTGLDPQIRHAIWNAIRQLKEQGLTILLTTHYMEEAAQLADRVGIVDNGIMIAEGTPQALIEEHLPRYVLELPVSQQPDAAWEASAKAEATLVEVHGDRAFILDDDEQKLRGWLASWSGAQLRIASLEDVFLKLTGRSLRD
ncbi:MAG: ABC transporter ATP-binding protein [Planctomycetes bacterium]|nr:ABC transporter ATP-binding protein [Planctomycetota bacterium]